MIKIIKEGKKEFNTVCPTCGCEFSYGFDDLKKGIAYSIIKCPCCGDDIVHSNARREFAQGVYVSPSEIGDPTKPTNPCETCSFNLRLKTGEIYVGDSPCQWCQYGLKVTCTSTGTTSTLNETK